MPKLFREPWDLLRGSLWPTRLGPEGREERIVQEYGLRKPKGPLFLNHCHTCTDASNLQGILWSQLSHDNALQNRELLLGSGPCFITVSCVCVASHCIWFALRYGLGGVESARCFPEISLTSLSLMFGEMSFG